MDKKNRRFMKSEPDFPGPPPRRINGPTYLGPAVEELRQKMEEYDIKACIVPNSDEHMNDTINEHDTRLAFLTGYSGQVGTAIVTTDRGAFWTDSRYYFLASQELIPNWFIFNSSQTPTVTEADWLLEQLKKGDTVAADARLFPQYVWKHLDDKLSKNEITLLHSDQNLVDILWGDLRPPRPSNPVYPIFNAVPMDDKVAAVRKEMTNRKVDLLILTALDEIAWLFNLRGSDLPYSPLFFSFAAISHEQTLLFVDQEKLTEDALKHLTLRDSCFCLQFKLFPYAMFYDFLVVAAYKRRWLQKIWIGSNVNYFIYAHISDEVRYCELSPISLLKCVKTEPEIIGMRDAHVKEGIVMVQFLRWLEETIKSGEASELIAAEKLEELRRNEIGYVGPSYPTTVASQINSAILCYTPDEKTDRAIEINDVIHITTGAHYIHGTTLLARTLCFGEPKPAFNDILTRVFQGLANFTVQIFPPGSPGEILDVAARRYLWEAGFDYSHETGHGIGHFLTAKEGPISITFQSYSTDPGIVENSFLTVGPSFSVENNYGARFLNVLQVAKRVTRYTYDEKEFLGFNTVTLCPIHTKNLVTSMLNSEEKQFLNGYNEFVKNALKPILTERNLTEEIEWLETNTAPVE